MKLIEHYSLDELKQVYRALHSMLPEFPDLMDSTLLEQLQRELQECATADGVDVSLHAKWAAWLGEPPLRGL